MRLNAEKCAIVTFHRNSKPLMFDYCLSNTTLCRKSYIRDLGIGLSSDLSPELHIDIITRKAAKMLGFIIRTSRSGLSVEAMKIAYTALVRSVLEYGCVVWCPYQLGHIQRLQSIQDRFVRIIGTKLGYNYSEVPLELVADQLGLAPLYARRRLHDLVFLQKILTGDVDCSELLHLINLRVPGRTRSLDIFCVQHCSTNYEFHSVIPRLHRLGNLICHHHDLFCNSVSSLKRIFLLLGYTM
ncbi:uncharacterized protein LOC124372255 [Homalodisca vitripennis]|uniref:uncharacterized protein LOC124372255 n=1 Tax=Homalodisca vitripennis TaxID=197043 RepID=UPI001EEB13AA|nr:uncharacterized protein LOC124372255 [Homalodisca vitripennis]